MLQCAFTYNKELLFTSACHLVYLSYWVLLPDSEYGFQSVKILAVALPFTSTEVIIRICIFSPSIAFSKGTFIVIKIKIIMKRLSSRIDM